MSQLEVRNRKGEVLATHEINIPAGETYGSTLDKIIENLGEHELLVETATGRILAARG
jgi:hypothetical protein